ncbi:MAG TPA: SPOR domain-containing protein, partial [Prolixibacteraceae bacterium]|nr:SPOR domain-containing protein [Prolixibacteraceae bacterium]
IPDIFRSIETKQDPELMELVNLHIRKNQQGGTMPGFRVEIFFSSELNARQKAQNIKGEFLSAFPDYNVYISYISPDFKVRVGNFRTRNEALKAVNLFKGQFPKAFVVPDQIELPKLY